MELEQEKFSAIKELSEIQTSISEGRATLSALKTDTDEYLAMREGMAVERVLKVLNESREALENTTKNHAELESYGNELKAFASTLRGFSADLVTLIQNFRNDTVEVNAAIDSNLEAIAAAKEEVGNERKRLADERAKLDLDRIVIDSAWTELRDRQAQFIKSKAEITGKKPNI